MINLDQNEVLEDLFEDKKIVQNTALYRFTSDSILLSKFARAKKGDVVADFCSGSGVVGLHFLCLNGHISGLTLFEMQQSLAKMSEKTVQINGFDNVEVVNCKLQEIGAENNDKFSLILCNPPDETGGFENDVYEKAICRKEITLTLKEIAKAAAHALKFGGRLCMLHRADRLAEVCYTLHEEHIEVKKIQFVGGRYGSKPYLVMVEAVKGGKPHTEIMETIYNVK